MKKYLALSALLTGWVLPAHANVTVNLDAGELTSPSSAPMQVDDISPSSNGSLLLLIDLGSSDTIDNSLSSGEVVSGTNTVLAAAGFNTNGGTNETLSAFTITGGTTGDDIALRWFPQITLAEYDSGDLPTSGDYFGTYTPTPLGSTPDGGDAWTLPSTGTISLNFFTSNSDGSGSQLPSAGYTNFQIGEVPEPSTFALFSAGAMALFFFARRRKAGMAGE